MQRSVIGHIRSDCHVSVGMHVNVKARFARVLPYASVMSLGAARSSDTGYARLNEDIICRRHARAAATKSSWPRPVERGRNRGRN